MRLVFLGSGEFAVPPLEHLCREAAAPLLVITQPDRPAGRGRVLAAPAVKSASLRLGLPVNQPVRLDTSEAIEPIRAAAPDFLVVVDYGQILRRTLLALPRLAAVNLHGSLLPRWRGAAPVARAILAGDLASGVTTIRMDAGVDTGEILLREEVAIAPRETAGELEARLAAVGARLLLATLRGLAGGTLSGRPQPADGATGAPRLTVEEAELDWGLPAEELDRRVRGYNPRPVAWTRLDGARLRIWRSRPVADQAGEAGAAPGAVVRTSEGLVRIACGRGFLDLEELQFEGGRRLQARDVINGRKIRAGQRLGA